ncbi:Glycoside Hydrolase Family 20 protein [Gigaspora rosea]|uniref:Beta-hexosaminidase n=1 Tax=Gigaspora rosea TaxID=44941 RepID=A0A397UHB2_9GLOM|nr:Glycoside Hydrolase Family 20 protein [Gigaspora rosea]
MISKFIFQLIILLLYIRSCVNALWPLPQYWAKGSKTLSISPDFSIKQTSKTRSILNAHTKEILKSAEDRLLNLLTSEQYVSPNVKSIFPKTIDESNTLNCLTISITTNVSELDLGIDESYELIIPDSQNDDDPLTAHLKAQTVFGVLHGFNTFSQLLYYNGSKLLLPFAPHDIKDFPRFSHRGLLLDTARNYFPIKDILKTLDIMSWNKFNVFHWHITDSPSWPVVSEVYPELSNKGSYDPKYMIYTKDDIKKVIEYAKFRGIRIIPEFDMPGHTHSIAESMPEIMTCINIQPNWSTFANEPPSGQLNPALPETYTFLHKLLPELTSYFVDKYYHSGGDEVNLNCWNSTPSIIEYLSQNSGSSIETLLSKFINETHGIVRKSKKIPIVWQEMVVDHKLPLKNDTIIQVWTTKEITKEVVSKGYRVITGSSDFWYLDCGHGAWLGNDVNGNSWCDPYKTWQKIYSYNPIDGLTDEETKLVLGGEVHLWTEQTDPTNLENLLWPRASAAAEVLWSGPYDTSKKIRTPDKDALARLTDWRFRMVDRGVNAIPLQPLWCARTGMCDVLNPQ